MSTLDKIARPVAMIAIGAAALLATPTLASAKPSPSASPTTSSAASAADSDSASVGRKIDKTGWYGGFAITVDEVATEVNGGATELDLELSYENLVGEALTPPDKAYLEVNGGEVIDLGFDNKKIAGFGKGKGAATASLGSTEGDVDEVLDNVVLVYGEADGNLTKIPLAEDAKVESIEPKGITVGQTIGDKVAVTLTKAFLWPSYQPGEKGKYELWVEVSMASSPDVSYGYNVYPEHFSVSSPKGNRATADKRSTFHSELLSKGSSIEGEWLIFLIDEPAKGDYTFTVEMDSNPKVAKDRVDASTTVAL
ncbi:hypothetical protein ACWFRB_11790 [Rhodococcus sp. NPDC055112]